MSARSLCCIIQGTSSSQFHRSQSQSHSYFRYPLQTQSVSFSHSNFRETHLRNLVPVQSLQVQGGLEGTLSPSPEVEESEQKVSDFDASFEDPVVSLERSEKVKEVGRQKKEDEEEDGRFILRNGKEVLAERAYLVGVEQKGAKVDSFGIEESLQELAQLADTAGLHVVGSTYQKLASPNPRTYIGSGKVAEIKTAIQALHVETVIFDDELSPGQLRNLEKALGGDVRVCDRTALILDIFNQRAATHEASLQVALAQMEYQLPRLTRMWSHLERQAGGKVKGMGEKQIEVDKRILRDQIAALKKELESVQRHRQLYRNRRVSVPIPVVSLVGYTNAGKSTLLNQLTGSNVLAEDRLFATLDPTTRRVQVKNGKEFLLTDTVGFIQKLPTMLVAAFRATLEEISESSLLVHVVDISHPLAEQQKDAVEKVLSELDVSSIPVLMVWNKVDKVGDPEKVKAEAKRRGDVVCISALTGEGLNDFCNAIQEKLKDSMVWVEALVPFDKGELLSSIHKLGIVERTEYTENGTLIKAYVPLRLARQLTPMRQMKVGIWKVYSVTARPSLKQGACVFEHLYIVWSCSVYINLISPDAYDQYKFNTPYWYLGISLSISLMLQPCTLLDAGCDASVLLDDSTKIVSEKRAAQNANSLRGFEVIDEIKAKLESACPGVVSCADILAMAARDATFLSGGPFWELPLGRRDSKSANLKLVNDSIPSPFCNIKTLIAFFKQQGLNETDLVALSGGHTIGMANCSTFKKRLYRHSRKGSPPDVFSDETYLKELRSICPLSGGNNNTSPLDYATPMAFDSMYFKLILGGRGLLDSDQALWSRNEYKTATLVQAYAEDTALFFSQFAKSMVKMGSIKPLLGSNGEIRKNCRRVN